MPNSRHSAAIFSPSSSRATNFSRSSMGSHTFQGILRPPQKAPLCYPCLQNELSPFFQEGHNVNDLIPLRQGPALARVGGAGDSAAASDQDRVGGPKWRPHDDLVAA